MKWKMYIYIPRSRKIYIWVWVKPESILIILEIYKKTRLFSKLYKLVMFRSSRPEVFCKKGLKPTTLFKKGLWHRCFPVNFTKFLRISFFIENLLVAASGYYHQSFYKNLTGEIISFKLKLKLLLLSQSWGPLTKIFRIL